MARDPISPELALIDPALASRDRKAALSMIEPLDLTNARPSTVNGSVAAAVERSPSVEALLFESGAISADQLGELVRDSVLTQRPVAVIAIERGLTTPEALAALRPPAESGGQLPELSENPDDSGKAGGPTAETPETAPSVASEVPEAAAAGYEPQLVPSPPRLAPLTSLDERVQAALAGAVQAPRLAPTPILVTPQPEAPPPAPAPVLLTPQPEAPPPAPAPVAVTPQPEAVALSPDIGTSSTPDAFAIVLRLQTGEQLAVETASTFEGATELARSLAGRFARVGEWPLIAGRCIRPEAVVSIDIERALES